MSDFDTTDLIEVTPALLEEVEKVVRPLLAERGPQWDAIQARSAAQGITWTMTQCPVQAEGALADGRPWYFRARGSCWSFSVAAVGGDAVEVGRSETGWCLSGQLEGEYSASWMLPVDALAAVERGIAMAAAGTLERVLAARP